MIELEPIGIAEQRLEVGRGIIAVGAEADEMLVAAAVGELDQAQPVAARDQPHRLGIDRDRHVGREQVGRGKVFFVKIDRHDGLALCGRRAERALTAGDFFPSRPVGAALASPSPSNH